MILGDSNVWLALVLGDHAHHVAAKAWLDSITVPHTVLFCRSTQQSFLRLLTSSAVLAPYGRSPLTNDEAWAIYEAVLADDRVSFRDTEPAETEQFWSVFARRRSASPKLWMDAYLAGFAVAGGLTLVTTDGAFRQFDGLDVQILET